MSERMEPPIAPDRFTVVTWNILLDKTRTKQGSVKPQAERIASQADTLNELDVPLDIVTIQEAEKNVHGHNGHRLAGLLGFEHSFWHTHNRSKRKGEYIGTFGRQVHDVEFFDIGHDKMATLALLGEVAVVGIHLRREHWGTMRHEQVTAVIERLDGVESAVIAGDTNALWFEKSRRALHGAGFCSVFHKLGQSRPQTFPTDAYRDVMLESKLAARIKKSFSLDDIYVRGLGVVAAGAFDGDSDHKGLWATLSS